MGVSQGQPSRYSAAIGGPSPLFSTHRIHIGSSLFFGGTAAAIPGPFIAARRDDEPGRERNLISRGAFCVATNRPAALRRVWPPLVRGIRFNECQEIILDTIIDSSRMVFYDSFFFFSF